MKLTEIQLSEYLQILKNFGGRAYPVRQSGTDHLMPIKLPCPAFNYLHDESDVKILAGAFEPTREVPEVLFEAPKITVLTNGLPILDHYVTGRLVRSKKFIKRIEYLGEDIEPVEFASLKRKCNILPALLLGPVEEFNYSHWILEAIPKIKLFFEAYHRHPQDIIIWGKRMPFHESSIRSVCPEVSIHHIGHRTLNINNVAFTTSVARGVAELNKFVPKFLQTLSSNCGAASSKRIYITRKNAGHRKILNEDELIEMLLGYEFIVVDPGALSFQEQINVFSDAGVVISPHGAGLTNIVFAKKLNLLVEIFSSGFQDQSAYSHLARHLDVTYCPMSFPPAAVYNDRTSDPETWPGHSSFYVDCQKVQTFLLNHLV
jgi:hypothetical protein